MTNTQILPLGYMKFFDKSVNWLVDDIRVILTYGYTPVVNTHWNETHLSGEVVGDNYTQGGILLTGKTLTYESGSERIVFKANDVIWSNVTVQADKAVIYADYGANKILLGYLNFADTLIASDSNFTIYWSIHGIFTIEI